MTVRRDPTQLMQIGFLALLSISAATVGWWMYDHVRYARSVEQRFPNNPAVAEDSAARINRVLWEGGFFLVVLIGGMAVLTRTLRHDAELRRRQQNFLAAVSHEFKSPLASIQLAAETLVLRSRDDDGKRWAAHPRGRRAVAAHDRQPARYDAARGRPPALAAAAHESRSGNGLGSRGHRRPHAGERHHGDACGAGRARRCTSIPWSSRPGLRNLLETR